MNKQDTNDVRPVLRVGCLAYYDSLEGAVPCKVLQIMGAKYGEKSGPPNSRIRVKIRVTAPRGPWKRGELLEGSSLWVVPRAALRRRRHGARITYYTVDVG